MMGYFLLMLLSLCFSCNIGNSSFIFDKFFTIKKFNFSTKKTNISLRLIGQVDLWSWNDKSEVKLC